jgi:ATP-grasp in the biosynthetic pathway with Ter operon
MQRTRIWFNKCYSSVHGVFRQLRADWGEGLNLIASHTARFFGPFVECDVVSREPSKINTADYVDWCLKFCSSHSVDVFVPGRMRDAIADRRAEFEARGVRLVLAGDGATLRLLEDKGRFFDQTPLGIPVHDFYRVRTWPEFEVAVDALVARKHRVCFKSAIGTFGVGFYILDGARTPLKRLLGNERHRISRAELGGILQGREASPELLVMEYLPGPEFSVDVLAHEGNLLAAVCRRKPKHQLFGFSRSALAGEDRTQIIEHRDDIEGMVRQLVAHFHLGRVLNMQFRSRAEASALPLPCLLEINGRMSGGLGYAGLTGINLLFLAVKVALLKEGEPLPPIPAPVVPLRVQQRSEGFACLT